MSKDPLKSLLGHAGAIDCLFIITAKAFERQVALLIESKRSTWSRKFHLSEEGLCPNNKTVFNR